MLRQDSLLYQCYIITILHYIIHVTCAFVEQVFYFVNNLTALCLKSEIFGKLLIVIYKKIALVRIIIRATLNGSRNISGFFFFFALLSET